MPSSSFARQQQQEQSSPVDRGILLLDQKKYDEAISVFKEAIAKDPGNPLPYYYTGVAYRFKRDLRNALIALNKAIQLAPGFPHAILEIGIVLEELGSFDNALAAYKALAESKEETPVVKEAKERLTKLTVLRHFRLAQRLLQDKRYEDSLKELDAVLSLAPAHAEAYFTSGIAKLRLNRFKDALDSFTKASEIKPDYVDAYYQIALLYELAAAYEKANAEHRKVISLAPASSLAMDSEKRMKDNENKLQVRKRFESAADFIKQEKWPEALEETKAILLLEPDNPNAHFNHGLILYNLKETIPAIESLTRAIEIDPKMQKAHYQLAVIYDDSERYEEAEQGYTQVIALGENTPEGDKAKERLDIIKPIVEARRAAETAKELLGKEDILGTIREMEVLLRVKKDDPKLYASLATLYIQVGRFRDAATVLEKAVHLSPKDFDVRFMLAKAYDVLKEYGKAAEAYGVVASQGKGTPIGDEAELKGKVASRIHHFTLARKYLDARDYEASLRETEAILEMSPDEPVALFNKGVTYILLNRFEEAEVPLEKAVSIAPDYSAAYMQLAVALERLRKFREAREAYEKVIEMSPDSKDAAIAKGKVAFLQESELLSSHLDKGIKLMDKKDWKGARKEIEAVIDISPNNYLAHYYLGVILSSMGISDEAEAAYKKASEVNPKFTQAYLALGDLMNSESRFEDARRAFEEAAKVGKDTPDGGIAETRLKELRPWRGSFSMSHAYNSNLSFESKAKAKSSVTTGYTIGVNYSLLRTKDTDISTGISYSQSIYYDTQSLPNSYTLYLNGSDKLPGGRTLSADLTYSTNFYDGEPTFEDTGLTLTAKTEPRTIPTAVTFKYDFSSENSLVSDSSDAERHNTSVSFSQKVSLRGSLGGTYAFNIQKNLDPLGSNYANRTHNISLNYNHSVSSGISAAVRYSMSFVNYSNPDSNTFFQQFRRNTNNTYGGSVNFKLSDKISSSVNYSYTVNRTNLPRPTSEEKRKLDEILATPIPNVGGGYRKHDVSFSLSFSF